MAYWPLVAAGFMEWSKTTDALLGHEPVVNALDLFRGGLLSDRFRLLLVARREEPVDVASGNEYAPPFNAAPWRSTLSDSVAYLFIGLAVEPGHSLLLSQTSIARVFGFDIVTIGKEWIEGHLLWVRPELRGHGLTRLYFEAVVGLARSLGLKGFRFLSTLPYWSRSTLLHQEPYLVQENGVTVTAYWKEVQ